MFLETIRCDHGLPRHLPYHQRRLEETLRAFGSDQSYPLDTLISPPPEGIFRCRFVYDSQTFRIEYHPYLPRPVASLKAVLVDELDYRFKYTDRHALEILFAQRGECDDVLIIRNGQLTDTTIANIALRIDGKWFTPAEPLLGGTTRARLIDEGTLIPASLTPDDLQGAEKIALMNAMMGFLELEHGIIA